MTPFQTHVDYKLKADFPEWSRFREMLMENGSTVVRYMIPSPANSDNLLYFVVEPDGIITKFACHGSHEHYDPETNSIEDYEIAYDCAIDEFVNPVLGDRLVVVWYDDRGMLVANAKQFVEMNDISTYTVESWNIAATESAG